MKTTEIVRDYLQNKKRIAILENDKIYLDNLSIIRVTSYDDEKSAPGGGLEERYHKLIDRKEKIELELAILKAEVAKVDKVIELIGNDYKSECQAFKLRHLQRKSLNYIESELGYSRTAIIKKIQFAELEFQKMMA
ncbi:hypothetical protein [Turicibacter sanguinis]|uniref:hypothetical protein n=1 Tax=Turicibacter sanguinis TaxID=154288 RepID=UPI0006C6308C|nr:hypothetical protein [Turicibacter sanguinis]CUN11391.1 Uncharacterised protein [Turicibacter sanguinis]